MKEPSPRQSLFLQFFGPQVLILLVSLGAIALYAWHTGWQIRRDEQLQTMYAQAELVARAVFHEDGTPRPADEIARFCRDAQAEEGLRFTVLTPAGRVLADTEADARSMPSHADRPEIREALRTGRGCSDRYSATSHNTLFYAARAIRRQGAVVGVVRVAMPHAALVHELAHANRGVLLLLLLTCAVAALLSYLLALRVIRPLAEMRASLTRIGAGDLETRLPIPPLRPFAELAHTINQTTAQLRQEIHALAAERHLRECVLASMLEGVVALDNRQNVVVCNRAARRLLGMDDRPAEGRPLIEQVRHAELLALVEAAGATPVERELRNPAAPDTVLWARASALHGVENNRIGTLLVLDDLTNVRRLERVRQEFVSNVSHELRTPVTSIIGFAETLLDAREPRDPATVEQFLQIIRRQASHLSSIISDLLLLSRLEDPRAEFSREPVPLQEIVEHALEVCQSRTPAGTATLRTLIPPGMQVFAHAGLLEQALVNLIQNAIQHAGGPVEIQAEQRADGVQIRVRDAGAGIPPEHLDRIFERFYRIDKGRSRELGGTGLGLSIVKHIAQAHQGTVSVASAPGKGSSFSIWLPGAAPRAG